MLLSTNFSFGDPPAGLSFAYGQYTSGSSNYYKPSFELGEGTTIYMRPPGGDVTLPGGNRKVVNSAKFKIMVANPPGGVGPPVEERNCTVTNQIDKPGSTTGEKLQTITAEPLADAVYTYQTTKNTQLTIWFEVSITEEIPGQGGQRGTFNTFTVTMGQKTITAKENGEPVGN